jgi:hypothetical protein
LPKAAGQLVRILAQPLLWRRDSYPIQQEECAPPRVSPQISTVAPVNFLQLIANRKNWIERGYRFLKDHRHPVATQITHPTGGKPGKILTSQPERGNATFGPAWQKVHDGECRQ